MRLSQHHIHFLFTKVDCLGLGVSKEINILQAIENGKKLHVQVEVLVYWKVVKHGIVSLWRPYLGHLSCISFMCVTSNVQGVLEKNVVETVPSLLH